MKRLLISAGLLFPLSLFADACIADLPPPATCPPKEQRAATDCGAIGSAPTMGCLAAPQFAQCLTGPRASCACTSNECPSNPNACYPAGDCPSKVVAIAGKEARCFRLAPEEFLPTVDCLCGCAACASVCDGVGPVITMQFPPNGQVPIALALSTLKDHLPEKHHPPKRLV